MTIKTSQMKQIICSFIDYYIDPNKRTNKNFKVLSPIFWGPSGIAKTAISVQAATEMKVPILDIRLPQFPREDISGIPREVVRIKNEIILERWLDYAMSKFFPVYELDDEGNKILRKDKSGYRINWERSKSFIQNYDELLEFYNRTGLSINEAPGGVMLFDELTRLIDLEVVQMMFQLFEKLQMRDWIAPDGVFAIACANPPTSNYKVSKIFSDEAFAGRFIHYQVVPDKDDAFKYMEDMGYDEHFIDFFKSRPKFMIDDDRINQELKEFKIDNLIVPQIRRTSHLYAVLKIMNLPDDEHIKFSSISGIIGTAGSLAWKRHENDLLEKVPSGKELLEQYDEYAEGLIYVEESEGSNPNVYFLNEENEVADPNTLPVRSSIRKKVLLMIENNRVDFINELCNNLIKYIEGFILKEDGEEYLKTNMPRIVRFLFDIPPGDRAATIKRLVDLEDEIHEAINNVFTYDEILYQAIKRDNDQIKIED